MLFGKFDCLKDRIQSLGINPYLPEHVARTHGICDFRRHAGVSSSATTANSVSSNRFSWRTKEHTKVSVLLLWKTNKKVFRCSKLNEKNKNSSNPI